VPRKTIEEGAHPLDVAIGARVRLRRKDIGLSQSELAQAVGVRFQQIQKYELGINRISFSRLIGICQALKCSFADLMGDLGTARGKAVLARQAVRLSKPGASDLLAAYGSITSPQRRRALLDLARQLAAEQKGETGPQSRK
jgi:transcriptional regulator with XRE-family HTH domain